MSTEENAKLKPDVEAGSDETLNLEACATGAGTWSQESDDKMSKGGDQEAPIMQKKESAPEELGTEAELEDSLSEDIYSLIYSAPFFSQAFVFAVCFFGFQLCIIFLALSDLTARDNANNPLQIPPGVNMEVRVAQGLAILLAVMTQDDLGAALIMLHNGYDKDILKELPSASCFKWFLSGVSQLTVGIGMLYTIFVLVMQSSTVIGMFLNFAALAFISEIDNVAFALAKRGFATDSIQQACRHVTEHRNVFHRKKSYIFRRIMFFLVLLGMYAGYGIIVHQQKSGKFLCDSIFVQFGDSFRPPFGTFSGVYHQQEGLINRRVTYTMDHHGNGAMFGYCDEEEAWTWTFWFADDEESTKRDPCLWYAKSPPTETYDMTTVSENWLVLNERSNQPQVFSSFHMACNDCVGGAKSLCSSKNGRCENNQCICNEGRYGLNCEFEEPCFLLVTDRRKDEFPLTNVALGFVANRFLVLVNEVGRVVEVYNRPVYVASHDRGFQVLLFTGRRWIVTDTKLLFELHGGELALEDTVSKSQLVDYLTGQFHAFFSIPYIPMFVSEAMDVGTPSDALTPVGLEWFRIRPYSLLDKSGGLDWAIVDETQPTNTALLCTVCNDDNNLCYALNECVSGACICRAGYAGNLCEVEVPCEESGCMNGGNCTSASEDCICPENYGGHVCDFFGGNG